MPNGGMHKGEFEELEAFFRPVANAVEEFASNHNLLLERYYHDAPAWSLRFAHPAGGSATISVARESSESIVVSGTWWLDVYSEFTRYLRDSSSISCSVRSDVVTSAVESTLTEVLQWKPGIWSRVARGYEQVWGKFSQSEFDRMSGNYPQPKLVT